MFDRFTDRARKTLGFARQAAVDVGSSTLGTEHILQGLVRERTGVASNVLRNLDVSSEAVRRELRLLCVPPKPALPVGQMPFTHRALRLLQLAAEESADLCHSYIGTEHLLLGCLRVDGSVATRVLWNLGLRLDEVREEILELLGTDVGKPAPPKVSRTPTLDAFTRDLVELAHAGELDPVLARPETITALIASLGRREHPNAVLVGEEGSGRRSIVHSLAFAIADGSAPRALRGVCLRELDVAKVFADTRYRGTLEARIDALCAESKLGRGTILVFRDVAPFLESSEPQAKDYPIFRLFAPAIAKGELRCIARVNPRQYQEHFAGNPEVARLFDVVPVSSPDSTLLRRTLELRREGLQEYYNVIVSDDALVAACACAPDSALAQPGAALSLLDTTCARAAVAQRRRVDAAAITDVARAQRLAPPRSTERREAERSWADAILRAGEPGVVRGTCAVLLPPGSGHVRVYDAIRPVLEACGLRPTPVPDLYRPGETLGPVWHQLRSAELIVADTSTRDPGVACALGLCLALKRRPLLLTHDAGDLLGGLRTVEAIRYDPVDLQQLQGDLRRALLDRLETVPALRA
jgi:ATP-dependent Clp protease ATP-binding subunit ClpA